MPVCHGNSKGKFGAGKQVRDLSEGAVPKSCLYVGVCMSPRRLARRIVLG